MCVGDGGMTIGDMICDKKIMVDKDVNDAKKLTNMGAAINNDDMVVKIEFALGVVMRSRETCGGDQVGATLDDDNLYSGIIKKDYKAIVNDARRKMYTDWKIKTDYLKSMANVTNTSDGIHDLNESSNNIDERDLRESKFQKSALRLRIERMREKNIDLIPRLDSCNENNKLSEIKEAGDIIDKDIVSNAITDDKNRVHSGDGDAKDEQSENDNVVSVDRHEVTTEIITNIYKDIFGEVDEKDTVKHLIELRQGDIEKDFTGTEPHGMEMKMDEFQENPEYKHVERVLKKKGKLFNIYKQILKENNGNPLSKADEGDDQYHSRNMEKKIDENQNEVENVEVNNDNTINMRLEELLNLKKGGNTRTLQLHQIPNSTSESIESENFTSRPIKSENETSIERPKHPRLKKLLALRTKTKQCHIEKNLDTRLQKLLASRKKNIYKNTQTLDT